jgi:hypothetical protein
LLCIVGEGIIGNQSGNPELELFTDDDGSFKIPGIIPGRSYSAYGNGNRIDGTIFQNIQLEVPVEKNIGDVKLQKK